MVDHYEVLQVHPKADPDVIRAAFRTLARKYHPDFGGDQRQMMALNDAWNVLGDRKRRAAYDANRAGGPRTRTPAEPPPADHVSAEARTEDPPAPASGPLAAAAARRAKARGETPAGQPRGTVIDFGRYAGWTVAAIAEHDPDYLLWLERTPVGRPLRAEIRGILGTHAPAATATAERPRSSLLRRRAR
jgi:curved DNA-binding protein CbpA